MKKDVLFKSDFVLILVTENQSVTAIYKKTESVWQGRRMLNPFKCMVHKRSVNISERDNTYKVKYLGNVLISFMRGDGCVDRPLDILWKNYLNNEQSAFSMKLTICASGLKVQNLNIYFRKIYIGLPRGLDTFWGLTGF